MNTDELQSNVQVYGKDCVTCLQILETTFREGFQYTVRIETAQGRHSQREVSDFLIRLEDRYSRSRTVSGSFQVQ